MKKVLSTLLAALMVVCLLPMAAFAEEVTYNSGDEGGVQMSLTVEGTVQYTVNVSASPAEGGSVSGGGKYDENTSVTVTATPNDGYTFTGWLENGEKVENAGASYTFTASADRTLTAVFEPASSGYLSVFITKSCYDYFNISGEGDYRYSEMVTVTAVPKNAGIKFLRWWKSGEPSGTSSQIQESSYSFNIYENTSFKADFGSVQTATIAPGSRSEGRLFTVYSENANKEEKGYVLYTSEGPGDLKFHFPSADCFPAPEGKVFDCWEMNGVGYAAGSVQTVIGSGANPAFASDEITITAKWKNDDSGGETDVPSCVISIPEKIDIPYMQEKTLVNWKLESLNLAGHDTLDLTFFAGTFSNSEGQTIAYTVAGNENADGDTRVLYIFNSNSAGAQDVTVVNIAKEEWEAAAPGNYTATLRFNVYFR